ncbi:MAG: ribonuclease HII [Firmicutes bacterium HGW-Firmicutes-16]|nr:MAG: ribonuclease HII [Firmicutes bacterium HGW-Firmicutes-16]
MDLWAIEQELLQSGVASLCGVDEAGRGPLAGPVCAAAVILPHGIEIKGLNDSKKLTEKKREELFSIIIDNATSYGIAFASVAEIEEHNILGATYIAMNRAIAQLSQKPELALIDGNQTKGIEHNCRSIVEGDAKCASIAAASILAKVTRDRLMLEYAETFPHYGFAKHKGYGTKEHYSSLLEYGPCEIHRFSFLKKFYAEGTAWTKSLSVALESKLPQNT